MSVITGKSALVLGGVGGIGKAIVSKLLSSGVTRLGVIDIVEESEAKSALGDLLSQNQIVLFVYEKCFVEDEPELRKSMTNISERLGGLDFIINSVGILNETDPKKTILINYYGTVNSTLIGIDLMRKDKGNRGGLILNVASITGVGGHFWLPVYAGSKHAVVGFTRSLVNDAFYDQTGVGFITINPGVTETPLIKVFNDKHIFPEMLPEVHKIISTFPKQEAECVGLCVIEAINDGVNGSVWQVENKLIKKIQLENGIRF